MKRGSIYWINLEPANPPEMGKVRPGLVVSNSDQNSILSSVVIVPLSSLPKEIWPLRIELKISKQKNSFAVIPGVRQVSKVRIGEFIANINESQMEKITEALQLYLQ